MARLPVYTAQGNINANITSEAPARVRNIEEASAGINTVRKTADYLGALAEQWQGMKDQVENLDGKNKLVAGMTDVLNEAQSFTDYNNFQDLKSKEDELLTRMDEITPNIINGFSNNMNAAQFQQKASLATFHNKEKLKEIFRNKYIDNAKSNLIQSQQTNMENYIATGNAEYKMSYLNDLEQMFRYGFIDESYKTQMGLKTDKWDVYHVMRLAESDPDTAIKNLQAGKYNIKPEDYHDLLEDLTKIKTNAQLMREYEENVKQNKGEDEATQYIYGNTSYDDKLKYINEQEFLGNISEKFAQQARRNIKQFKPNNERTLSTAQSIDEIMRRAYDLNESGVSDEDYLTGIRNIRNDINVMHENGDISTADAIKMNNQLSAATNKKLSEATNTVADGYGSAKDYIDKVLPPEMRAEAIREVFYDTSNKDTSSMDKKQLQQLYYNSAIKAVEKVSQQNRKKAMAVKQGETRELTYYVDSKIPQLEKKLGVKMTVTDRYAKRKWTSEHTKGIAFDVSMSEQSTKNREKIVKAMLDDPAIKYVSTSDPALLKKYKDTYGAKLRDFTATDKKLGTNHKNHIHVTVNSGGNQTTVANGKVRIKAPNGSIVLVPQEKVSEALKNGGIRI